MKLVLLVVLAIAICSAESRNAPDNPETKDDPDHNSMEERIGNNGIELRGNSGKKDLKTLMKKLGSVEQKLIKAISDMNTELQVIKKHQESIILYIKATTVQTSTTSTSTAPTTTSNTPTTTRNTTGLTLFGGQYLSFSTDKVSWLLANKSCESNNGRLAIIANPQTFHTYLSSKYRGQQFWLGASDRHNEGTWTWINGQPLVKFPWPSPQPDDAGGNQDCLYWGWGDRYDDAGCTHAFRYVCEHGYN